MRRNEPGELAGAPGTKLSEIVARRIVDFIRGRHLPDGSELGTEQEAMRHLRVSRSTFREAVRQLEWQGVVKVRRGLGGGLRTAVPRAFVPLFTLKHYFELSGVEAREMRRSFGIMRLAMQSPWNPGDNAVLDLLAETVDGRCTSAMTDPNARQTRLAELVAHRITLEIEGLRPGDAIGNEVALMKRHKVGRGAMREALRLMELNSVIELRRGGSGGAFVHTPSPDFAIYACCVYLALARVPLPTIIAAQLSLSDALATVACTPDERYLDARPSPERTERLSQSADDGVGAAAALDLQPIAVIMTIFSRFWREFAPLSCDLAAQPTTDAEAPSDAP